MDPVLLFATGAAALWGLGGVALWLRDPRRRARRALSSAAEKPLAAIGEGERVRVRGIARRGPERRVSPITGRECIGYRLVVDAAVEQDVWKTVLQLDDCVAFELHADGLTAHVDGPFLFGLSRDSGGGGAEDEAGLLEALERYGVSRSDDFGRRRTFRLFEARLEEGDSVYVLGRAALSVDQRGQRESPRGQPVLRLISGTDKEPTVLADVEWPGVVEPYQ